MKIVPGGAIMRRPTLAFRATRDGDTSHTLKLSAAPAPNENRQMAPIKIDDPYGQKVKPRVNGAMAQFATFGGAGEYRPMGLPGIKRLRPPQSPVDFGNWVK